EVDLSAVEQIVELAQTRAMAEAIVSARGKAIDGHRPMAEALAGVMEMIDQRGLDVVAPSPTG
ncbi:MAG: ATPase, partial [Gammaproteobacteria bacterium]|nr:ATPase [Gammaproteobacteria bacterium]